MPDIPLPPALALSRRVLASSFTIPAGVSAYVAGELELLAGVVLALEADAVLEVG